MDENKDLTPAEAAAPQKESPAVNAPATQKAAPVKAAKKQEVVSKPSKFAAFKAEIKKIVWPNKQDLRKKTGAVIVTSLIMGVIIFAMDTVFTTLSNLVLGLLG